MHTSTQRSVHLIYAGGTFGSHGRPLAPLAAEQLLPIVQHWLTTQLSASLKLHIIDNCLIKDSSQFSAADFVHFYHLILTAYAQQQRQFVLITGTDTLSYLAAFLAEAFAGSDICIVVTGSMQPLLDTEIVADYRINPDSDACSNLQSAVSIASSAQSGVWVSFADETWAAQTVQKLHSHDVMAFTGHQRASYPANSYLPKLTTSKHQQWYTQALSQYDVIENTANCIQIYSIYCLPNAATVITDQLLALLEQPASAIILFAFGSGNLPYSDALAHALDRLYRHGHLVVCASQCPFGGVSDAYAAGSWQYQHHVLSAARLSNAAIYARLLWLHLSVATVRQRRQRWQQLLKKDQLAKPAHYQTSAL